MSRLDGLTVLKLGCGGGIDSAIILERAGLLVSSDIKQCASWSGGGAYVVLDQSAAISAPPKSSQNSVLAIKAEIMRISVIKGVARNIAHFALSGSAYGAPERTLGERRSGLEVKVAILAGEPPELPGKSVFMQSASEKLLSILRSVGLSHGDVQYAFAEFYFKGQCRGADKCVVTIKLKDGRSVSGAYLSVTIWR